MSSLKIHPYPLNKPEKEHKSFLDQGFKPNMKLAEGIEIGIDKMTINITYKPLGTIPVDINKEVSHKTHFVSYVNYV